MPDWNDPTVNTDNALVWDKVKERDDPLAKMDFTGVTNIPIGTKRFIVATGAMEQWDGVAWIVAPIKTTGIENKAVTFPKIQDISSARLLGRSSGGSGVIEQLTVGNGLSLATSILAISLATTPGLEFVGGNIQVSIGEGLKRTVNGIELDILNGLTDLATPAVDDRVPILDLTDNGQHRMRLDDLLKVINSLTDLGAGVDLSNDFVLLYDTSAAAVVKTAANNIGADPQKLIKVWARFSIAGVIRDSFNVDSITDVGVGNWTVNITNDFPNANYAALVGHEDAEVAGSGPLVAFTDDQLVGSYGIRAKDKDDVSQDPGTGDLNTMAIGD